MMLTPPQCRMLVALASTEGEVLRKMLVAGGHPPPDDLPHAAYYGRVLERISNAKLQKVLIDCGFADPEAFG